ncbi:MAG TPA: hypothetical protein VKZ96_08115 [Thermomicrobiales bacterium]|nr:hypothetical protein [Thermomicrobiales bacterium]
MTRPLAPARWLLALALLAALLTGCLGGDDDDDGERPGQITRPAGAGLPLDDPVAVQAFDRADQLLLDWFILGDLNRAQENFSANLRTVWASIFDGTTIDGECSFTQVEGSQPDASGTVSARYAIDGCRVAPPGDLTATHITILVTVTDQNAWVISVEFR